MATKTPRKSATAIAPLPVVLPPAPNAHTHKPAGRADKIPETHVAQSYVDAFLDAESNVRGAAVELFRACVEFTVSPAQFGARSDAKVRASEFNSAHKVRMYFGQAVALELINAAAERTGDKRRNVLAALRKAKELGDAVRKTALKGAALSKALSKAAEQAKAAAAEASADFANEAAKRGAQHRVGKATDVRTYAPLALAALSDMLDKLGKLDVQPRQLAKVKALGDALTEAADIAKSLCPAD